ncbi:GNAT family N-acetyltransferase [Salinibacterium sp. SWN1162]|uniref:GNAT family N-acetyltransferase n=1 Tax=Salinibacterium sp. SWN1162 TaxID=2792053 RepID=UPI0018CEAD5B|nr:GNAT family protein [Salinibacterium sp. SWN1162]MBH0009753.1 GNAT family N-acetyltransferase [Salinibacterium sp. SWN1162]
MDDLGFSALGGIGEEDLPDHVAAQPVRCSLRPWQLGDAAALLDAYRSTPDLGIQLGSPTWSSEAHARDFIAANFGHSETHRNWAIVDGTLAVGNVGISSIDRRHDTAWLYYWLAASARGRGLATRALATVCEWAFDEGLFRLELGHRVNNPESCGVATRAGFAPEGIERQKLRYGSERFDVELHARLRTDREAPVRLLPLTT